MFSLVIQKESDAGKLGGWTIQKARVSGVNLVMEISHPLAESHVELIIEPAIAVGMSGNITVHNPNLKLTTRDVAEEKEGG